MAGPETIHLDRLEQALAAVLEVGINIPYGGKKKM